MTILEFLAWLTPDALIHWALDDDSRRGWLTAAMALLIAAGIITLILWGSAMPLWLAATLGVLVIVAIAPVIAVYLRGHEKTD